MDKIHRCIAGGYPVMNFPDNVEFMDLTDGYDSDQLSAFIASGRWGIGGYLERREQMYTAPQYENKRYIHMGIDIWAPGDEPVFAPVGGIAVYKAFHDQTGNYGGTVVIKHNLDNEFIFALYGHLSKATVEETEIGKKVEGGDLIGRLGGWSENGNWPPHLHLELSVVDPGKADMPGVVSLDELDEAKKLYPDPKVLIGDWYT
jgi:murein DD-endopeptidase MepM/ murein hydrolase activator NlpD